jgi:hypothetical protein
VGDAIRDKKAAPTKRDFRNSVKALSAKLDDLAVEPPLSRADALRWAVENVKTWPADKSDSAPTGREWQQCSGMLYLQRNGDPLISMLEWGAWVAKQRQTEEFVTKLQSGFQPLTSLEDSEPATLHTVHHAAFLHHDCQLLLNEPELVVFRTADGELLHCKPKECLIDPDPYGLAARLLSDMSGCTVAPEHIRELAEQMGWAV